MLTDAQIKKAKAGEKAYKLTDGGGLHVFVTPAGGKLWRLRYEIGGKEKLLSLGPYPALSLADARKARDAAKADLRDGRDPSVSRKQREAIAARDAANTFEVVAREWHQLQGGQWTETHSDDVMRSFERDVFPTFGSYPITEIEAPEVLALIRKIEKRPAVETARRIRQRMSAVFVYAIAKGIGSSDPAGIIQGAMAPLKKGRQPAVTDLAKAREMLERVNATPAHPVTKLALRLLALTALRPGTLIATPWAEINEIREDDPVWRVSAERMKLRLHHKEDEARDHMVPLAKQSLETIDMLRRLTGKGPLVFPCTRHAHRPMSANALGYLLNRAGYHHRHVPHGWRTTFSTVMNENFSTDRYVIDLMLAHVPKDRVEGAYNRSLHLARRSELAQIWADMICPAPIAMDELLAQPRRVYRAA